MESSEEDAAETEGSNNGEESESGAESSEWLLGPSYELCRPLFLLLYQIFSILLIPGVSQYLTELTLSIYGFLLFLHIMHPASEYQPYKKKARWKRTLDKQLIIVNKKLLTTAREAYLYLTARRKKQESFKKRKTKME